MDNYCDGYCVERVETENSLQLFVGLKAQGVLANQRCVWEVSDPEGVSRYYPEWRRRDKLLRALTRALNEGADPIELQDCWQAAAEWADETGARLDLPLVGIRSDEVHVRLLLLADGNYLRIIEEINDASDGAQVCAEVLTPEEMQDAMVRDQVPAEFE